MSEADVNGKLDTLIRIAGSNEVKVDKIADVMQDMQMQIADMSSRLQVVEQASCDLDDILRGSSSGLGLTAEVALLKQDMNTIKTQQNLLTNLFTPKDKADSSKKDDDAGPTWKWITDNYTTVLISIVLYLVFNYLLGG